MVEQIVISAWSPAPVSRPHLNRVVPIDSHALNQLMAEARRAFPDYEVVQQRRAMAGKYGRPDELIRWCVEVQGPWLDTADPRIQLLIQILAMVIGEYLNRRIYADTAAEEKYHVSPPREEPPLGPEEDAVERVTIYGPSGQVLRGPSKEPLDLE